MSFWWGNPQCFLCKAVRFLCSLDCYQTLFSFFSINSSYKDINLRLGYPPTIYCCSQAYWKPSLGSPCLCFRLVRPTLGSAHLRPSDSKFLLEYRKSLKMGGFGRTHHSLADWLSCCWFSWIHQGAISPLVKSFQAPGLRPWRPAG